MAVQIPDQGQRPESGSNDSAAGCWSKCGSGPAAQKLLSRLRWATLGVPYNWTARSYDHQALQRPIPQYLAGITARLVGIAEAAERCQVCGLDMLDRCANVAAEGELSTQLACSSAVCHPPGDALGQQGQVDLALQMSNAEDTGLSAAY